LLHSGGRVVGRRGEEEVRFAGGLVSPVEDHGLELVGAAAEERQM
jgi:hypothetical protein